VECARLHPWQSMRIRWCLKFEAIAEFGEDLAGIVVVEAAEGDAVVEQHAMVGYVGCCDGRGDVFAEGFSEGEVEGCVCG
jgi:hypothetical protein